MAVNECDCLIAIGARFDDRVTGKISEFAANANKEHIDIDPASINKNVQVNHPIVGDVGHILKQMNTLFDENLALSEWWDRIKFWQTQSPIELPPEDGKLRPQTIIKKYSDYTQGKAVVITDVGQHQMWTAQHFSFNYERSHITSGGLGTMGFSLPAAIGAAFGVKDRPVLSFSGDGGVVMNIQEIDYRSLL